MLQYQRVRWSDNDKHFGPFTFARTRRNVLRCIYQTAGDEDEVAGNYLQLSFWSLTFIINLPPIVSPYRRWVDTSKAVWHKDGMPHGYWEVHPKEFGFSLHEGFLQVFFGAQTGDSSTTQDWCKFLPWTQWRHVRHSCYDLNGELHQHLPSQRLIDGGWTDWRDACPSRTFAFDDFDGERIHATTRIEELEWRFGEGWFKWLSVFRSPRVVRSLDIKFDKEVGKKKGSWKMGTVGHGIEMQPGELHGAAFRRYCKNYQLRFVEEVRM